MNKLFSKIVSAVTATAMTLFVSSGSLQTFVNEIINTLQHNVGTVVQGVSIIPIDNSAIFPFVLTHAHTRVYVERFSVYRYANFYWRDFASTKSSAMVEHQNCIYHDFLVKWGNTWGNMGKHLGKNTTKNHHLPLFYSLSLFFRIALFIGFSHYLSAVRVRPGCDSVGFWDNLRICYYSSALRWI